MTSLIPDVLVFAADIGDVVTFLIAVFVGLASLMSFLKDKLRAGKQPDVNRPRRPAPKRDRNLQSEIDRFLQEVGGKSAKRPAEQPIEILEVDEARRRTQQQTKPQPQTRQPEPARSKPGSAIAGREAPGSDDLGSSVRQHVSEHMVKGRLGSLVAEHLPHDIEKSVSQHLGTFSAARSSRPSQGGGASRLHIDPNAIISLLRSPGGVQQAVLLAEILSRPKARL